MADVLKSLQLKNQKTDEIYTLEDKTYFKQSELKGEEPDFTIVRDEDETKHCKQNKVNEGF
ncbi:MAG: hypothetical protein ACRCV7_03860 [Culicoidibacterales bacterium]